MGKKYKLAIFLLLSVDVVLIATIILGNSDIAVLNPKGVIAYQERNLIFASISLMLIMVIPGLFTAYFFASRYRPENKKALYEPEGNHGLIGGFIWWVIPSLVVGAFIVVLWKGAHTLDPYKPIEVPGVKPIHIQVVALNWKWLFIYPEQHIATVNFIQFPQQTPLNFELTADAPMNSFWIPQLGGQMYAMTGMVTQLHLMADGPGEYTGSAAEINGRGFAGMRFVAKSSTQADFDGWISSIRQSQPALTWDEYNRLAQPSEDIPRIFYSSVENGLYNKIIMKYMVPTSTDTQPQQSYGNHAGHAMPKMQGM